MSAHRTDTPLGHNRVLITGASGFIGNRIYTALIDHGYKVSAIGRMKEGFTPDIEVKDLFSLSTEEWSSIVSGFDVVVHLAWYVNHNDYRHSSKNVECLQGTKNLISAVAESDVEYFLASGTCLEYQETNLPMHVDMPLEGDTEYSRAKVESFRYLSECFHSVQKKFGWARIFFIYGEGEPKEKLYSYVTRQLSCNKPIEINEPSLKLDFISVEDAVEQITSMVEQRYNGAANICSGISKTIEEFVLSLPQAQGKQVSFEKNEKNGEKPPRLIHGLPTQCLSKS